MTLSKDMARQLAKKSRYWQRLQREKAMQRPVLQNHSREYSDLINLEKASARQAHKLDQMRRS